MNTYVFVCRDTYGKTYKYTIKAENKFRAEAEGIRRAEAKSKGNLHTVICHAKGNGVFILL